jgi:hypothetical protein
MKALQQDLLKLTLSLLEEKIRYLRIGNTVLALKSLACDSCIQGYIQFGIDNNALYDLFYRWIFG